MDTVCLMAHIAFEQHKAGQITKDELMEVVQRCINLRAQENGYAEKFGLPFPEVDDEHDQY